MLSFELAEFKDGEIPETLEVYLDREGLESLLAQLRFLEVGKSDHVHLMAESWGGTDLDDEPRFKYNPPLRHVKIVLWPPDMPAAK